MKNWKRNGWKLADGSPVKNKEDLVKLDEVCSKISVSWVNLFIIKHENLILVASLSSVP